MSTEDAQARLRRLFDDIPVAAEVQTAQPAAPLVQITGGTVHGGINVAQNVERIDINGPAHFHVPAIVRVRERYDYSAGTGPEHIDDAQKARLRELVNEIVALETAVKRAPKRHGTIWAALTAKFKTPSYHRLKAADFERAEAYLMTWCGRLRHAEAAPKKDADWRNSRYRYIHGVLKDIGRIDELPKLLAERYSGRKLDALSALELETVYQIVAEWKKQARRNGAI